MRIKRQKEIKYYEVPKIGEQVFDVFCDPGYFIVL